MTLMLFFLHDNLRKRKKYNVPHRFVKVDRAAAKLRAEETDGECSLFVAERLITGERTEEG